MPAASLSSPETIAEHLLEAVRVERSGKGTADSPLPPEHWIDTAMVAELAEHARKLMSERARQESESGGDGSGGASGSGAEEAGTAAAEGKGEDEGGGEGKDTASSKSSSSRKKGVALLEVWAKGLDGKPAFALRKRPGRAVKLVHMGEELGRQHHLSRRLLDRIHVLLLLQKQKEY
jgi:hypothetical protein